MGSSKPNDYEQESDLDEDIEEDNKDPNDEFAQETEAIFLYSNQTQ